MDALLFMILALILTLKVVLGKPEDSSNPEIIETASEDTNRVAKLNETFYEDPEAFCDIIHALGFPKEKT